MNRKLQNLLYSFDNRMCYKIGAVNVCQVNDLKVDNPLRVDLEKKTFHLNSGPFLG
jgi:hypothetical protein